MLDNSGKFFPCSYLAGMFLEDEREATGIQEDVYFKKKPSLLLLDPKSQVPFFSFLLVSYCENKLSKRYCTVENPNPHESF
jgi:hypothetical protein